MIRCIKCNSLCVDEVGKINFYELDVPVFKCKGCGSKFEVVRR